MRGLSVKVRGGGALEVKVYRGSPGILEVAGRARGRLEAWQKWSFPFSPLRPDSGDPAGWRPVRKRRRITRFSLASGPIVAPAPGPGGEPRCEVELTEVRTRGQDWWTLGFEATGPASLLRSALEATAALVFAQALPGGVEPGPDESRSYTEWLCLVVGCGWRFRGNWGHEGGAVNKPDDGPHQLVFEVGHEGTAVSGEARAAPMGGVSARIRPAVQQD